MQRLYIVWINFDSFGNVNWLKYSVKSLSWPLGYIRLCRKGKTTSRRLEGKSEYSSLNQILFQVFSPSIRLAHMTLLLFKT
ncbi:hypothetical protein ACFX13_018947 [Malus domestica]